MSVRSGLAVAVIVPCLLLVGCRAGSQQASACSVDPAKRPATVLAHSAVRQVPVDAANVVLDVRSSASRDSVRMTVRFDGALALHVKVPGTQSGCRNAPIYRYGYRVPAGKIRVTAKTDQGQRKDASLTASEQKRWIVLMAQKGFPLHLDVSTTEPGWPD